MEVSEGTQVHSHLVIRTTMQLHGQIEDDHVLVTAALGPVLDVGIQEVVGVDAQEVDADALAVHVPRPVELVQVQAVSLDVLEERVVHLGGDGPAGVAVAPDLVGELGGGGAHRLVVPHAQPAVVRVGRIFVEGPLEVVGALPDGVLRGFPGFRHLLGLLSLGEVGVDGAHVVVQESEGRVIDNVGRDDEIFWVIKLVGDELRDGIVADPDLRWGVSPGT